MELRLGQKEELVVKCPIMDQCTIHFRGSCLKAFDLKNYYGVNDTFDYQRIIVEKNVQAELRSGEREMLLKLSVKFV